MFHASTLLRAPKFLSILIQSYLSPQPGFPVVIFIPRQKVSNTNSKCFPPQNVVRTASTIAPFAKPAIFFNARFMTARRVEGCHEKNIATGFLVCKGLSSNDYFGVARRTVVQEIRQGDGFKTSDFRKSGGTKICTYHKATRGGSVDCVCMKNPRLRIDSF